MPLPGSGGRPRWTGTVGNLYKRWDTRRKKILISLTWKGMNAMPKFLTPVRKPVKVQVRDSTQLEQLQDELREMVEAGPSDWMPEDKASPTLEERQEREEAWIRWHEELVSMCRQIKWENGLD